MSPQRENELLENPHLITHAEVRMLTIQNRLNAEMLMLRNQQIRRQKVRTKELIEHMLIGIKLMKKFKLWNHLLFAALITALIMGFML